jgi:hypothetical protein
MSKGMQIFENEVRTVRQLLAFDAKLSELRQAEAKAEQAGKINEALGFFTARMEAILAGPGNVQALATA